MAVRVRFLKVSGCGGTKVSPKSYGPYRSVAAGPRGKLTGTKPDGTVEVVADSQGSSYDIYDPEGRAWTEARVTKF